jgi:hypothetical protein
VSGLLGVKIGVYFSFFGDYSLSSSFLFWETSLSLVSMVYKGYLFLKMLWPISMATETREVGAGACIGVDYLETSGIESFLD